MKILSRSTRFLPYLSALVVLLAVLALSRSQAPVATLPAMEPQPERAAIAGKVEPVTDYNPEAFAKWAADHLDPLGSGSAELSQDALERGKQLAAARRMEMLKLIKENPQKALDNALSWGEWAALPREVRVLVEEPFSETGDYVVTSDCRPMDDRRADPRHLIYFTSAGQQLRIYQTADWQGVGSKQSLPVQGIRIDGDAVLYPGIVQLLSPQDGAALAQLKPGKYDKQETNSSGVLALVGDKMVSFEDYEEALEMSEALAATLTLPGPMTTAAGLAVAYADKADKEGIAAAAAAVALSWSATPKRVIVIRLDFSDNTGAPQTQATLQNHLSVCSDWFQEVSYGDVWLSSQVVTPEVFRLPKTTAEYKAIEGWSAVLATDARALADAAGYDTGNNFDIWVYSFKKNANIGGGFANIGAGNHWESNGSIATYAHEFGHNIGLPHANFWVRHQAGGDWSERIGEDNSYGAAGNDEYGDVFDVMAVQYRTRPGIESVWPNGHFDMKAKTYLGWMDSSRVIEATEAGIYRIHRFDHPDSHSSGNPLALTFKSDDSEVFWVGFRRNFDSNATLSTGAYLVWENKASQHRQIDTTPFSQIDGITATIETDPETSITTQYDHADFDRDDSALPVGASWTSPDGSVRLTNLGVGGAVPDEHIDLMVEYFAPLGDYAAWSYYTDDTFTTPGLEGSYFNELLRNTDELDWNVNHTRTGVRVDEILYFLTDGWGDRASLGITGGTVDDWDNYSVQWDGYIKIERPYTVLHLSMYSDDGSRLWVDFDQNGTFEPSEELDNSFGYSPRIDALGAGEYKIRIQYEEKTGGNIFVLYDNEQTLGVGDFELYEDAELKTYGLTSSFVNSSLRAVAAQADWITTQTISGTRTEEMPLYWDNGMDERAPVGITGGSDGNWQNFSVQYDGWIKVLRTTRFTTYGVDGSRFWIDLDNNDIFDTTAPEYNAGTWGQDGRARYAPFSGWVGPGTYKLRIQHEVDSGGNRFAFMGQPGSAFSIGKTMLLDGSRYATAPAATPINGAFTVEAWVKPAHTGLMTIFSTRTPSSGYGFTFKIYNGNRFLAHIGGAASWLEPNALLEQTYRANEWMHIAYSVRPDGYSLYINGWLAQSGSYAAGTPVLVDATHPVSIGRDGVYGEQFNGQIDELRIWDYARSGQEIATTMRKTIPANTYGLASCWRMEGNLNDLTGARDATPATTMSYAITRTPVNEHNKLLFSLPVEMGVEGTGEIDYAGETDWYSIEVTEARTIEFWSSGNTDTFGTLYRAGLGGELVEIDDVDYPVNPNFHIFYDAPPGIYYLGISAFSTNTGPYTYHLNGYDSVIPFSVLMSEVTPDGPRIQLDSRPGKDYYFIESDDLKTWNYLYDFPFPGNGGRLFYSLPELAGQPRSFIRMADSKALFASSFFSSTSTPGSATIFGQTAGFLFEPGIPENFGDTALLLDDLPLTQESGVTIASSAAFGYGYGIVVQAPGELSDNTASFPAGVWIASNTSSGNEFAGDKLGLVHFPFADGWQGGHIGAAGNYLKTNTPSGFNIQPSQPGRIHVWMPSAEISPFNGALFVIGAENLSIPNIVSTGVQLAPDSSALGWEVSIAEANGLAGVPHGADWSFVYVPFSTAGMAVGWVDWDGSTVEPGSVDFTVSWDATNNRYELQIPDFADLSQGTLIINALDNVSVGGGLSRPMDCHFQWELSGSGSIHIYANDLPVDSVRPVQCGFVFAYVPFDRIITGPAQ